MWFIENANCKCWTWITHYSIPLCGTLKEKKPNLWRPTLKAYCKMWKRCYISETEVYSFCYVTTHRKERFLSWHVKSFIHLFRRLARLIAFRNPSDVTHKQNWRTISHEALSCWEWKNTNTQSMPGVIWGGLQVWQSKPL